MSVPPNIPGSGLLKLSYTVTFAAKTRLGSRQAVSAMRPENTPIRMTAAAPIGFRRRGPDSLAVEDDQGYADKCIGGALLTADIGPPLSAGFCRSRSDLPAIAFTLALRTNLGTADRAPVWWSPGAGW